MAFTIEKIEKALAKGLWEEGENRGVVDSLKETENYAIITEYLTGKRKTLKNVEADAYIQWWIGLVNLLQPLEKSTPDKQLVLDVFHHPHISEYLQRQYQGWLFEYAIKHKDLKSFQSVLGQLRQMGFNDDAIFDFFVFPMHADDDDDSISKYSKPLTDFLVHHVKRSNKLIKSRLAPEYWRYLYFEVLDLAGSPLAADYAKFGCAQNRPDIVQYFKNFKKGYYLSDIDQHVKKERKYNNAQSWQERFAIAMQLYETDKKKHADMVVGIAHKYLDYFRSYMATTKQEMYFAIGALSKTEFDYIPYSTCAFHFLLRFDRDEAINILQNWQQQKIKIDKHTLQLFHYHLRKKALPLLQKAITQDGAGLDYLKTAVQLLVNNFDASTYLPSLWDAVGRKSKTMVEMVAGLLAKKDPAAETKALALLQHKKPEVRQTAALILSHFSSHNAKAAISNVLNSETDDNARDILLEIVAGNLPGEADAKYINDIIAAARNRGKLDKPIETWLHEEKLPSLHYKKGKQVNAETTRFLLYRMSRIKTMRIDTEAKLIINKIDKNKSTDFAKQVIKIFNNKNRKPEYKYLLALAAVLGDDEITDKIRTTINQCIEENRVKMAEFGIGALALQGSNKALRWVEWYSRKYHNKKASVGAAAKAAIEAAAEELNISPYELGDRIIPDFGFDGLFKHFTVKGEPYRAFIDSNFKMAFFNDDNIKLKALPAATDKKLKSAFTEISKDVKDVVRSQSSRLEHYLAIQRKWPGQQWQQFFLNNPVMFIYATRLLWGVYDTNGKLKECFYCQEDTTLMDAEDNEITLPKNALVGIVHPLQLAGKLLKTWQQKFFDLTIQPVFSQLERPVYKLADNYKQVTILEEFEHLETAPGSIKSTLDHHGWRRDRVAENGFLYAFFKDDYSNNIMAVLEVEGIPAYGFDLDEYPRVGVVYFINTTKEKSRWPLPPDGDDDERLIPLGKLPPVFYSEVIAGIKAIKVHKTDELE